MPLKLDTYRQSCLERPMAQQCVDVEGKVELEAEAEARHVEHNNRSMEMTKPARSALRYPSQQNRILGTPE